MTALTTIVVVSPDEGRDVHQPHLDKVLPALLRRGYAIEFVGWDRRSRWPRRSRDGGVDYRMVLRGGGYSSRRLLAWMPVWYVMATLALALRPRRRGEVLMAMDFEGALPAAAARVLRGHRFVYNCRDNIELRYRLPGPLRALLERIDAWVMERADAVIFPDESRIPGRGAPTNVVVLPNAAPDVQLRSTPDPTRLTVYAMGNLRTDRGIDLLLEAAEQIGDCRVLAAGKCRDEALAERLRRSPHVDYRGILSPLEALELCAEADVVFTFYAPTSAINRRAVSNKWPDAMMAARPILVNAEVAKSAWVTGEHIGFACPYALEPLVATLRRIDAARADAAARGARGRELWEAAYRWDVMERRLVELLERTARAHP